MQISLLSAANNPSQFCCNVRLLLRNLLDGELHCQLILMLDLLPLDKAILPDCRNLICHLNISLCHEVDVVSVRSFDGQSDPSPAHFPLDGALEGLASSPLGSQSCQDALAER